MKQNHDANNSSNSAPKGSAPPVPSWRVPELFPNLSPDAHKRLKIYFDELVKFNKVLNLVSPKTLLVADVVHFADSILSFEIVYKNINKNEYLYDIGSGNGFPGLVYAALDPNLKMVLVDVDQRKCEFLKHTAHAMGLTNVTVENKNVEKLKEGSIKQSVMRGFAPLPRAMLGLRKLVPVGGVSFHLKSDEWSLEVSEIPTQLCSIWQPVLIGQYDLPDATTKFFVVKADKLA